MMSASSPHPEALNRQLPNRVCVIAGVVSRAISLAYLTTTNFLRKNNAPVFANSPRLLFLLPPHPILTIFWSTPQNNYSKCASFQMTT